MSQNNLVVFNLDLPSETGECWNIFLNNLKQHFDEFAMYQNQKLYFDLYQKYNEETEEYLPELTQEQVQEFIDNFKCSTAEDEMYQTGSSIETIVKTIDPTIKENLKVDQLWVNKKTGDIFTCIDNTEDKNVWVGTKNGKLIRPIPLADKVDFFEDNSTILFSELYENAKDLTGRHHGKDYNIEYEPLFDKSVASSKRNGTIKYKKLPTTVTDAEVITIASWVYWDGNNGVMPYGWDKYDVYVYNGMMGFNTSNGDVHGFDITKYKQKWIYLVTEFRKNEIGKFYVNTQEQSISSKGTFSSSNAKFINQFTIFGWKFGSSYRRFGKVGRLRMFNKSLTNQEVIDLTTAEIEFIKSIGGKI